MAMDNRGNLRDRDRCAQWADSPQVSKPEHHTQSTREFVLANGASSVLRIRQVPSSIALTLTAVWEKTPKLLEPSSA